MFKVGLPAMGSTNSAGVTLCERAESLKFYTRESLATCGCLRQCGLVKRE